MCSHRSTENFSSGVGILNALGHVTAAIIFIYPGLVLVRIVHAHKLAKSIVNITGSQAAAQGISTDFGSNVASGSICSTEELPHIRGSSSICTSYECGTALLIVIFLLVSIIYESPWRKLEKFT